MVCSAAMASDKVHVEALGSFSSLAPAKTIDVKVIEPVLLGTNLLHKDDILHCNVVKVVDPKRGKRGASFVAEPISYTYGEDTIQIKGSYYGKYAERIISKEELKNVDKAKVGKKAAKTIGNHFIKGIAPVASLAEGVIKNEEGNRLESGVKQVYEDSVFSYAQKGKDLVIEPGNVFYLVFKPAEDTSDDEE